MTNDVTRAPATRVTTSSSEASASFARAAHALVTHRATTAAHLERTLAHDPELAPAHALRGLLALGLGRRALAPAAREAHARARASLGARGGTPAEACLVAALDAWLDGDPLGAAGMLEQRLEGEARGDAEALFVVRLKLAHGLRLLSGDPRGMRTATERARARLDPGVPDYGYVLGMHAFALGETGALDEAARAAEEALARAPDDAWGAHAALHVLEVRGMPERGLDVLASMSAVVPGLGSFGLHLAWHEALFEITRGARARALEVFDLRVGASEHEDFRDYVNATSLLFRLEQEGVDVGPRWQRLADIASRRTGDHGLPFADVHYVLALHRAGHDDAAQGFVASMREAAGRGSAHGIALRFVEAMLASGEDADRACAAMRTAARRATKLGGSRVQRELLARVTIEVARRADLAGTTLLLEEHLRTRPVDRWAEALLARTAARSALARCA